MKKRSSGKLMLKRRILKLALLVFVLAWSLVGSTNAYLFDQESASGNYLAAASLDFSLISSSLSSTGMKPGDSETMNLRVEKEGSLDFKYGGRFAKNGGDDAFCGALNLEAKLGGATKYNGSLAAFVLDPALAIGPTGGDDWTFILSLNSAAPSLENKTCSFDLVFSAWQAESDGNWGFRDEEILGNLVTSGDWTAPATPTGLTIYDHLGNDLGCGGITDNRSIKVDWDDNPESDLAYYQYDIKDKNDHRRPTVSHYNNTIRDQDGLYYFRVSAVDVSGNKSAPTAWCYVSLDRSVPTPIPATRVVINEVYYHGDSRSEWVEIYNAGGSAVDLNGWTITDNNESDLLASSSLVLAPESFAVIVGGDNSGQSIATGATLVVLSDTRIGGGLANSGDKLILKDNLGNIIDQMNYGDDTGVWNPARAGVADSHSLARSPKGYDTDQPSDFVDLVTPNPGTNPHPPTPTSTPAPEPQVTLWLSTDKRKVSFEVTGIKKFEKLSYEIIYDTAGEDKGIAGSVDLAGEDTFGRGNLVLGSCSSLGEVCTYDQGITKINLKVILDDGVKVLGKEIIY